MLKGEPNWIVKHAIEVVVGAVIVGTLGWLTSNYISFFSGPHQRVESLRGEVFSMEAPQWWLAKPERASLVFSKDDEIENTKKIFAGLAVGNEVGDRWEISSRQTLLKELKATEKLCHITNADNDHGRYFIGLRLNCDDADICSFRISGSKLWAVLRDVSLVISDDCESLD